MPKILRLPKTKRGAFLAAGGLVGVGAGALALVYFLLFPTSSPKPFALTSPTVSTSQTASGQTISGAQLAGRWTIATGSQAGYRVREKLAILPAQSDAVGRTSAISGEATFTRLKRTLTITAASFTVDVSKLASDRSMRDQRIHTIGLQSDLYPTASFVLSTPLKLPTNALPGRVVQVPVTGVLKIHGTSNRETITLKMRLLKSAIEVVGSLTFPWSAFHMIAPSVGGGFVNVANKATMEFDLHLKRE